MEDYREEGMTIMPLLYKVYTTYYIGKLREEVEGKGLIPPNQTRLRKGMGTLDIYTLIYIR